MTAQWLMVQETDGLAVGYRVLAVLESGGHPAHTATGEIIVSRTGLVGTAFELPGTDDIEEPAGCYWVITAGSKEWRITLPDSLGTSQGSPVLVGYPPIQRAVGAPPPSWPAGALPGPGGTTGQAWGKRSNADNDTGWITVSGGPGGAVDSVNAKTGAVVLTATDVGADAAGAAAAATAAAAQKAANLSDLASASTARTNLGLGTAATSASTAFDAAGAAATAQSNAISTAASDATSKVGVETSRATTAEGLKLAKASNLSDVANAATARTNLGLGTAAVLDVPATGNATSAQVVKGDDTRLSGGGDPRTRSVEPAPGDWFTPSPGNIGVTDRAMDLGRIVMTPFIIDSPMTISGIGAKLVATAAAGCVLRAGLMGSNQYGKPDPTTWFVDAGTVATDIAANNISWTLSQAVPVGTIWAWIGSQGPSSSSTQRRTTYDGTLSVGTLQSALSGSGGWYANLSSNAAVGYSSASTPAYESFLDCEPMLVLQRSP